MMQERSSQQFLLYMSTLSFKALLRCYCRTSCRVIFLRCRCKVFTHVANRFKEIVRFLRLDKKSSRSERLQINKFALFSMEWNRFVQSSVACFKPEAFLMVDEQLFPSKARCSFTQFMASKPDKYGQKCWLAVEKDSKYISKWISVCWKRRVAIKRRMRF